MHAIMYEMGTNPDLDQSERSNTLTTTVTGQSEWLTGSGLCSLLSLTGPSPCWILEAIP